MAATFGENPLQPHLGQALQRQGERPSSLWIVCRGEVRALLGKVEVALIGPGAIIGELCPEATACYAGLVVGSADCSLLRASRHDFLARLGEEGGKQLAASYARQRAAWTARALRLGLGLGLP